MTTTSLRAAGSAFLRAASGSGLKRIRVGGVPEHFNTPWHTAIAASRFEEVGVRVEWTPLPAAPAR